MDKLFIAAIKDETFGIDYFKHIGVGKINATYNTLRLINIYKPKIIINYGTAGAVNKNLSGIIECTKFYQRDMDVRSLNFELGETPFDEIKEIIISENGYSRGSGDNFVSQKIDMNVDVVDMEAYALATVCKDYDIPFRCFKYISDAGDPQEWTANASKGVDLFVDKLKEIL